MTSAAFLHLHPFTFPCIILHTALTKDAALASARCQSSRCGCAASSLAEPNSGIVGPTILQIKRRHRARTTLSRSSYQQLPARSPLAISRQQTQAATEIASSRCSIRHVSLSSFI
jgi:hypothetical protein